MRKIGHKGSSNDILISSRGSSTLNVLKNKAPLFSSKGSGGTNSTSSSANPSVNGQCKYWFKKIIITL